ncbi:response regulator [Pseudoalteromonas luteoviolacea]|uniref:Response regulator containing CheY-like receiver, AAA-type ATPase, and DNA-binding domain protein n=3 Tax=Pseudoalteromonas TaxID=53246 RepID=V4HUG5_PSEL2|nr:MULTISPECIES: response regulator [Pseudoalteromonas]ESP93408.1 response regulator containing CheY-like receiver, AAA-type ATPase, and DNA-binding domain protein [Pseudoalteromonas luteoviolacea 2ta16]KZN43883.1 chemotaxis protein CheY [Pseudoalteromonas luteoviolacea NCIMB 1944]KZN50933.1 chemotaxis protein CheY [Pseudoalteromonas luteoviolacea H33]KZN75007.1 chemotaxis protein CheY [Pseudoalteromonas luteoviolacea H33-S]MBQ4835233.1 response regulator [Pseudoalteromonas luteoviolacea]
MELVRPLEPILIIDDVEEVRSYLIDILENLGFEEIYESKDFTSAKPLLESKSPNVLFLDIELPDTDGTQILEYVNDQFPNTHVIMCSGHNSLENVQNTWELGAKGFIAKPFNAKKVDTVMKRLEMIA